jgi:YHS domain-containing protein
MKSRMFLGLGLVLVAVAAVVAAEGVKLDGIKCVVAAKNPAKEANAVDYKGGKVFFCCQNCPKTFSKDPAKFATAANQQLVATGQAKQTACPLSGKDIAADTKISVNGTDVAFCCNNCKGAVEKSDKAAEMVFSDKAFEKGFKVSK